MKNLQELVDRDSSRDILAELDVALSQMRNGEASRETKYEASNYYGSDSVIWEI